MQNITDGGPAFPTNTPRRGWVDTCRHSIAERCDKCNDEALDAWRAANPLQLGMSLRGMSLRDYFAAKALSGICACSDDQVETDTNQVDFIAGRAYAYADAMLRARVQSEPLSPRERQDAHLATFGEGHGK